MININQVSMFYDTVQSLSQINAEIGSGSIYGLVGSNGSGKSTLLRVMAGIFRPATGEVRYDGQPIYENTAVKQQVIYLSDDQYFIPGGYLETMCNFFASVYPTFSPVRFHKLAELFRLPADRKINTYSKGMQKQTAIIGALAAQPKYLLCDETFDGLDPVMRQLVKRLLSEAVSDFGMTPVIASHNLREIEDICDHIGLLHEGKILFEQDIDDMKLGIFKVQCVFRDPGDFDKAFAGKRTINHTTRGSLHTAAIRGERGEIEQAAAQLSPVFFEMIPLTLEEIFICEMEDRGYDFNEILL